MSVYVSNNRMSTTYHTDPECKYITDIMTEKELDVLNGFYEECEWCSGEADRTGEYDIKECSACGEEYKQIANHLSVCPEL